MSKSRKRQAARRKGYKSNFEVEVAKQIARDTDCEPEYEPWSVEYVITHTYTPDFELPNGIIVEAKGIWDGKDRTKHLAVREQHPELDIRFVFMRDQPLVTRRRRTPRKRAAEMYSDWCEKHGFQYAIGAIPEEWCNE